MNTHQGPTRTLTVGLIRILDVVASPILALALLVGRLFRAAGTHRTPVARWLYDRIGVLPVRDHFYEPLVVPDPSLEQELDRPRPLPGLDLRVEDQIGLLRQLRYGDELSRIPIDPPGDLGPYFRNGYFGPGDAEILYSLIRHRRPSTVIEIGSGFSTRFALAALDRNRKDDPNYQWELVAVEPYHNPWLERLPIQVVRDEVESLDPAYFDRLGSGDILFIDSSHVARPGGDVVHEFLEVVPRLVSGVAVHVHDIRTPRDYIPEWVLRMRRLWTEQYIVEALLTCTDHFRVMLALNHLHHEHRGELARACPVYASRDDAHPVSLWFEVT